MFFESAVSTASFRSSLTAAVWENTGNAAAARMASVDNAARDRFFIERFIAESTIFAVEHTTASRLVFLESRCTEDRDHRAPLRKCGLDQIESDESRKIKEVRADPEPKHDANKNKAAGDQMEHSIDCHKHFSLRTTLLYNDIVI